MSKIREEIESFKFINANDPRKIEKLCEGSSGTLYRLKQTTQPLAIKCIKCKNGKRAYLSEIRSLRIN